MHVLKPDDVMLGQAYHTLNGKPYVFLTIAYLCDHDQQIINEQQAWPWLDGQKAEEPYDYGLKKARGTFGVIGSAYAPNGQAVEHMRVSVQCGQLKKQLAIYGDRYWQQGLGVKPSATQAFTAIPINLSNAFGGPGSGENVYGKGWPDDEADIIGRPLPNIELINNPILSPKDCPAVATLAVLSASSKTRTAYIGTLDSAWLHKNAPWVPADTDPKWFDLMPVDQCADGYWQGNESWSIVGMHPEKNQISGQLPGLRPRLLVKKVNESNNSNHEPDVFEAKLDLDTVLLFPGEQRVLLMYRAAIAVKREDGADISNIAIFTELQNQPTQTFAELMSQWQSGNQAELIDNPELVAAGLNQAIENPDIKAAQDKLNTEIAASLEESYTEGLQERAKIIGNVKNSSSIADLDLVPPAKLDFAALVVAAQAAPESSTPNLATLEADITKDVLQELEQGKQLSRQKMQQMAEESGLDPNDLLDLADKQNLELVANSSDSAVDAINNMDIPADVKSNLLGSAQKFDADMLSVDHTLADVSQQMDDLYAKLPAVYAGIGGTLKAAEKINKDLILNQIKENPNLSDIELINLDFSGQDLSGVVFTGAVIKDCNFSNAILSGTNFKNALIENCDFSQTDLNQSIWQAADIKDSKFTSAQAKQSDFTDISVANSQFDNCNFANSNWSQASADQSSFKSADFSAAVLNITTFSATDASNANFSHVQATGIRIDSGCKFIAVNFDQADLNNASLQNTDFSYAIFNQANLNTAYLSKCNLSHTTAWQLQAKQASFKDSKITAANWTAANLMQANFEYAVLQNTNFSGANLYAAETRTANIENLLLQDALLSRSHLDPEFRKAAI